MTAYTLAEVKKHNTTASLWVVNSDKVYDVTDFAGRHPGGRNLLTERAGEDITDIMQAASSHSHSNTAYQILDKYYIGNLDTAGKHNVHVSIYAAALIIWRATL